MIPTTDTGASWLDIPGCVDIGSGEVHVWRFTLDPPASVLAQFDHTLGDDERRRADRFRTETLRNRFVAGRGALRVILGACLRTHPERVRFAYGEHGKPRLADPGPIEFNLAHSHGLALCAVTLGRAVGIDVEAIRALVDADRIIERFFSAREQAEFLAHPGPERLAAFFRGWSRKEAFLKATGTGLATQLDSFDVTLGRLAALLRVGDDPAEAPRWSLLDVDPGFDFAAAVAVKGRDPVLRLWDGIPGSSTPGSERWSLRSP